MIYFKVIFLDKNGYIPPLSSDKRYLYKTKNTQFVEDILGKVLIDFRRKDDSKSYSPAIVVDAQEADNSFDLNFSFPIYEVNIFHYRNLLASDFLWNYSREDLKDFISEKVNRKTREDYSFIEKCLEETPKMTKEADDYNLPKGNMFIKSSPKSFTLTMEEFEAMQEKGENTMNTNFMKNLNIEFGKVTSEDKVAYSINGMAIKSDTGFKSYNPSTNKIVNVDNFVIQDIPLFKMPVAIKDIAVKDIILHNKMPMIVTAVNKKENTISAIDVGNAEIKKIIPVSNIFNFDYYTKIVNPFNGVLDTPDTDNPFGQLLPLMLLSDKGSMDKDTMFMLMMMNNSNGSNMNTMLPLMMMGDGKSDSMLMAMMMMNNPNMLNLTSNQKIQTETVNVENEDE